MRISSLLRVFAASGLIAFTGLPTFVSAECVMCGIGRCYFRDGNGFQNCGIDPTDGAPVCSGNCYNKPKCLDAEDPSCYDFSAKPPSEMASLSKGQKSNAASLMCASFEQSKSSVKARLVKAVLPATELNSEGEGEPFSPTANLVGAAVLKLTKLSTKSIADVGQFSFGVPANDAELSKLKRGEAIRLDTADDAKIGIAVYRVVESTDNVARVEMNTWLFTKQSRVVFDSARVLITFAKVGESWAPRSMSSLGNAPELDAKKLLE